MTLNEYKSQVGGKDDSPGIVQEIKMWPYY